MMRRLSECTCYSWLTITMQDVGSPKPLWQQWCPTCVAGPCQVVVMGTLQHTNRETKTAVCTSLFLSFRLFFQSHVLLFQWNLSFQCLFFLSRGRFCFISCFDCRFRTNELVLSQRQIIGLHFLYSSFLCFSISCHIFSAFDIKPIIMFCCLLLRFTPP